MMPAAVTLATARRHAFRPRYRGLALASIGVGGALALVALVALGLAVSLPLVSGALGVVLGGAYLASPTWRLEVVVDAQGLEVGAPGRPRFRLAWTEVVRVVASPSTSTCFVDGGTPARSLLVPGDGAPAPYDLEDKPALVAAIVAAVRAVEPGRVTEVAHLGLAGRAPAPPLAPPAAGAAAPADPARPSGGPPPSAGDPSAPS